MLDPVEFSARRGRPGIYLANHQVGVESFLFLGMIAAMTGIPAEAIAKKEHRDSWLGQIAQLTEIELKQQSPTRMLFFDREDQGDMLRILNEFGESVADDPRSLLVHVDGTRAVQAGQRIEKVSSVLIDLAIRHRIPIIPVRFSGGLPIEPLDQRLEFPIGMGKQDYHVGAAIEPAELESLPYAERARRVVAAINDLGPDGKNDIPLPSDDSFADLVADQKVDRSEIQRVLWAALRTIPDVSGRTQKLLDVLGSEKPLLDSEFDQLGPAEKILAKLLG
jgi:1-acyl-sn-glycerol-3-phosphate acyltransferase